MVTPYLQGDHLSGKPGNIGEFDSCQGFYWRYGVSITVWSHLIFPYLLGEKLLTDSYKPYTGYTSCSHSVSMWHTPKIGLTANKLSVKQNISRDVTDFKSDFKSDGFRHFFTNPNLSGLQTRFVSNSDLIFVLKFRKINCCLLTVWHWSLK